MKRYHMILAFVVVMLGIGSACQAAAKAQDAGAEKAECLYRAVCSACHDIGVAGAPIIGNQSQWAPRVTQGIDVLVRHVIQGYGAMPARGTCMQCSDADIRAIVTWMVASVS